MRHLLVLLFCLFGFLAFAQHNAYYPLIPYRQGNKWGYCDTNKRILISPRWKAAEIFKFQLARVKNADDTWNFIDTQGNCIIPPYLHWNGTFSPYYEYSDSGALNCYDSTGKWGMIDERFHLVIPCEYDRLPSEELRFINQAYPVRWLIVSRNGKYGIIDDNNQILVPFEYTQILQSYEEIKNFNYFEAYKGKDKGIIDIHNTVIAPFREWDVIIKLEGMENDTVFAICKNRCTADERYKIADKGWNVRGRWYKGLNITPCSIGLWRRNEREFMHHSRNHNFDYFPPRQVKINGVTYNYTAHVSLEDDDMWPELGVRKYAVVKSDAGAYGVVYKWQFIIPPQKQYEILGGNITQNAFVIKCEDKYGIADSCLHVVLPLQDLPISTALRYHGKYYGLASIRGRQVIIDKNGILNNFKGRTIAPTRHNDPDFFYASQLSAYHQYVYKLFDSTSGTEGLVSISDSVKYPAVSFKYRSLTEIASGLFIAKITGSKDDWYKYILVDSTDHQPFPGLSPSLAVNRNRLLENFRYGHARFLKVICGYNNTNFFYVSESGKIFADDLQFSGK